MPSAALQQSKVHQLVAGQPAVRIINLGLDHPIPIVNAKKGTPRLLPDGHGEDVFGGFRAGNMQLLNHAQPRDARVMYGDLAQADLQHLVGKGASFHFLIFIKIEIME